MSSNRQQYPDEVYNQFTQSKTLSFYFFRMNRYIKSHTFYSFKGRIGMGQGKA